jgi:hypothetical protein
MNPRIPQEAPNFAAKIGSRYANKVAALLHITSSDAEFGRVSFALELPVGSEGFSGQHYSLN